MALIYVCSVSSQFTAINDNSVTVLSAGECLSVVFKFKGGNATVASSASSKSSEYYPISSVLGRRETDVLILDKETDSSSSYLNVATSQTSARCTVISPSIHDFSRNDDNMNKSDSCAIDIGDNANIEYMHTEESAYVYFKSSAYSCVAILNSNTKSQSCPNSADVLIVRGYIPDYIDLSKFGCIIVVSSADSTLGGRHDKNVYFTEYNDNVTIRNGEIK